MENIKFKPLTTDNLFDFCDVIDAIGLDEIITSIGKDGINTAADDKISTTEKGMIIVSKIVPVLIRNISRARTEILTFLAGCAEHEDGAVCTVEELRALPIAKFIKLIRDFTKHDDLTDFFQQAAEFINLVGTDSASSSTADIQPPAAI